MAKKDPAVSANEKHYPSKSPRIMPGKKSGEKMQDHLPKVTSTGDGGRKRK